MLLRRVIEDVNSQNWIAIGIDFVIVVVGMFIGIQVSSWNDGRVERQLSGSYMQRIHSDPEVDIDELAQRRDFWGLVQEEGVAC